MDPATISVIVTGVVTGLQAVAKLIEISQHPATSPEQKAAALAGANQILAACGGLMGVNAVWASLAPKAEGK